MNREDTAMILEKDFDIHGLPNGDHVGRTMLHWAVEQSWSYALKNFSDKPKHWLDHQDRDGMTALHLACQLQNRRIAEHLVDSGANYLLKDKLGKTPGQSYLRANRNKERKLTMQQYISRQKLDADQSSGSLPMNPRESMEETRRGDHCSIIW